MPELTAPGDAELAALVRHVAEILADRSWTLATAESCTGGWIAKCCTDRPGSSEWYEGGVVSYSNRAKLELLGVDVATLDREGAVSRAVALQMAEGARLNSGADVTVAVTGIAGPDGGSADKPVGTVWLAWALPGAAVQAELRHFEGDREAVRRLTVAAALQGLIERLEP